MPPLIYTLHSGQLYGTERMALATLAGLHRQYRPVLLAPGGPVHEAAARLGIASHPTDNATQLARRLFILLRGCRQAALMTTGVSHSLIATAAARLTGCRLAHIHVVHGGTEERLSYGRKRLLERLPVTLVAVSGFVRDRLLAHGCDPARIEVIENFHTPATDPVPDRCTAGALSRVAVVSRIDPIKRIDLLLAAVARAPDLQSVTFDLFGRGSDFDALREAARPMSNIRFHGFVPDVAQRLPGYDLLLHTCAEEPFGLAILEAMSARVPVLVPNAGGAGSLVEDGITGFCFPANCAGGLARRLTELGGLSPDIRARIAAAAEQGLHTRFAAPRGITRYADLLERVAA